jgi:TatD DNase family protein
MLIDSHAHVNFNSFKEDGGEVLKKCLDNDVWVINVGSEYRTSKRAVEYAEKYKKGIYAAVGLHPIHLFSSPNVLPEENHQEELEYDKYKELVASKKVVAIGEVGLDYHHFGDSLRSTNFTKLRIGEIIEKQKNVFKKFIDLANEVQKPLAIHCWGVKSKEELYYTKTDAYDDLLEILKGHPLRLSGTSPSKRGRGLGVIHSFVGSWKKAQKFVDLGYKIGLNGIVTYSESYDKLMRNIDIKDILIETDCPYLTPKPLKRDSRNEPINVGYVAEKIAHIKNIELEEVERVTTENAKKLFGIKK